MNNIKDFYKSQISETRIDQLEYIILYRKDKNMKLYARQFIADTKRCMVFYSLNQYYYYIIKLALT